MKEFTGYTHIGQGSNSYWSKPLPSDYLLAPSELNQAVTEQAQILAAMASQGSSHPTVMFAVIKLNIPKSLPLHWWKKKAPLETTQQCACIICRNLNDYIVNSLTYISTQVCYGLITPETIIVLPPSEQKDYFPGHRFSLCIQRCF